MVLRGLLLCLLIVYVHCQLPCTFKSGADTYDLSPLTNNQADYFIPTNTFPGQGWSIWINVCRPTLSNVCGATAIACQQWNPSDPVNGKASMGAATSQQYESATNGVILQYNGGDGSPARETEIDFICDPNAGIGQPAYKSEGPTHHYVFTWNTAYACPVGSTGSKGGLSVGSILLIVLLVLVVVYLIGGILFNKFRRQLGGIELIPNVTFWSSIPGLVKDGVLFIVNKVKGVRGGYSQV